MVEIETPNNREVNPQDALSDLQNALNGPVDVAVNGNGNVIDIGIKRPPSMNSVREKMGKTILSNGNGKNGEVREGGEQNDVNSRIEKLREKDTHIADFIKSILEGKKYIFKDGNSTDDQRSEVATSILNKIEEMVDKRLTYDVNTFNQLFTYNKGNIFGLDDQDFNTFKNLFKGSELFKKDVDSPELKVDIGLGASEEESVSELEGFKVGSKVFVLGKPEIGIAKVFKIDPPHIYLGNREDLKFDVTDLLKIEIGAEKVERFKDQNAQDLQNYLDELLDDYVKSYKKSNKNDLLRQFIEFNNLLVNSKNKDEALNLFKRQDISRPFTNIQKNKLVEKIEGSDGAVFGNISEGDELQSVGSENGNSALPGPDLGEVPPPPPPPPDNPSSVENFDNKDPMSREEKIKRIERIFEELSNFDFEGIPTPEQTDLVKQMEFVKGASIQNADINEVKDYLEKLVVKKIINEEFYFNLLNIYDSESDTRRREKESIRFKKVKDKRDNPVKNKEIIDGFVLERDLNTGEIIKVGDFVLGDTVESKGGLKGVITKFEDTNLGGIRAYIGTFSSGKFGIAPVSDISKVDEKLPSVFDSAELNKEDDNLNESKENEEIQIVSDALIAKNLPYIRPVEDISAILGRQCSIEFSKKIIDELINRDVLRVAEKGGFIGNTRIIKGDYIMNSSIVTENGSVFDEKAEKAKDLEDLRQQQENLLTIESQEITELEKRVEDARRDYIKEYVLHQNAARKERGFFKKIYSDLGFVDRTIKEKDKTESFKIAEKKYLEAKLELSKRIAGKKTGFYRELLKKGEVIKDYKGDEIKAHGEFSKLVFKNDNGIDTPVLFDRGLIVQAEKERKLFDEQVMENIPPLEKGLILKSLQMWTKMPRGYRLALSSLLFTAGGALLGTSGGIVGLTGLAGYRFGKGLIGATSSQFFGKKYEDRSKIKRDLGREKTLLDYGKDIDINNFERVEKELFDYLEKEKDQAKKDRLKKALVMIVSGSLTNAGLDSLNHLYGPSHYTSETPSENPPYDPKAPISNKFDKPSPLGKGAGLEDSINKKVIEPVIEKPKLKLTDDIENVEKSASGDVESVASKAKDLSVKSSPVNTTVKTPAQLYEEAFPTDEVPVANESEVNIPEDYSEKIPTTKMPIGSSLSNEDVLDNNSIPDESGVNKTENNYDDYEIPDESGASSMKPQNDEGFIRKVNTEEELLGEDSNKIEVDLKNKESLSDQNTIQKPLTETAEGLDKYVNDQTSLKSEYSEATSRFENSDINEKAIIFGKNDSVLAGTKDNITSYIKYKDLELAEINKKGEIILDDKYQFDPEFKEARKAYNIAVEYQAPRDMRNFFEGLSERVIDYRVPLSYDGGVANLIRSIDTDGNALVGIYLNGKKIGSMYLETKEGNTVLNMDYEDSLGKTGILKVNNWHESFKKISELIKTKNSKDPDFLVNLLKGSK